MAMVGGLPSAELPGGDGIETKIRRVRVGEGHVLLARLASGEVVAFSPSCPHQFTELDEATISDGNLRCPRHGYIYDTRTGENIHPRRDALNEDLWKLRPGYLPCFAVREEDGWIRVSDENGAKPPPASYDPTLEVRPERGDAGAGRASAPAPAADAEAPAAAAAPAAPAAAAAASLKFLNALSGTTFEIRLPFVPRQGLTWRFDIVGQLLEVVDDQFEAGYSPCQVIRVAAQGVGAATLSCVYAADGGQPAEVRTYIVRVQPA